MQRYSLIFPRAICFFSLLISPFWNAIFLFTISGSKAAVPEQQAAHPSFPQDNQLGQQLNHTLLVKKLEKIESSIKQNAQLVSLQDAISLGLRNNPNLLIAFRTIQQYEWELIAAQRKWYPTISSTSIPTFLGNQWGTMIVNKYAKPGNQLEGQRQVAIKSEYVIFQPNVVVNWNFIDLTRQPSINSAADSLRQQKLLFDVSARNLVLNLQQTYYAIQSSKQLIDSSRQIYAINQEQLRYLEAQKTIGMVTVLDLEQTRAQLYNQLIQLVAYTQSYIEQTAQLAEFLALPEGSLAIPSDSASMQGEWTLSLNTTIQQARTQREEILASLAAAEAAKWKGITALRSYLPVFSLSGSGNLTSLNGYEKVPVPDDPSNDYQLARTWNAYAGIGFTWNLFDGGIKAATAKSFQSQARQQMATAVNTELQVIKEVRNSYTKLQTSLVGVESSRQAYRSAELAQEAARARFAVGIGEITSVVQAIAQLSVASQNLSKAILSHNNAIAELYRYSATWPGNSEMELQQRMRMMRDPSRESTSESTTNAP